jgi:hypothetical protein
LIRQSESTRCSLSKRDDGNDGAGTGENSVEQGGGQIASQQFGGKGPGFGARKFSGDTADDPDRERSVALVQPSLRD